MGIARKQKVRVEDPLWKKQLSEAVKRGDGNLFAEGLRGWEQRMLELRDEREIARRKWYANRDDSEQ